MFPTPWNIGKATVVFIAEDGNEEIEEPQCSNSPDKLTCLLVFPASAVRCISANIVVTDRNLNKMYTFSRQELLS